MGFCRRRIPFEVKEYKSQMFFGLTARQLICVSIGICLIVPTVLLNNYYLHLSSDTLGYVVMVEAVPCAACGWLSYNGMPIEQIALKVFEFYFGNRRRIWSFKSAESKIFDDMMNFQLEDWTKEREQELAEIKKAEKERKKEKFNSFFKKPKGKSKRKE